MVIFKDFKLFNNFNYCNVNLYEFQFVSCVCKVQLIADVELLRHILISFLCFHVMVEMLGR